MLQHLQPHQRHASASALEHGGAAAVGHDLLADMWETLGVELHPAGEAIRVFGLQLKIQFAVDFVQAGARVDFPDIAAKLADAMLDDSQSRGILICGTGAGMEIAANRYRHLRASRCDRPEQARDDRFHDDINVLTLAADDIDIEQAFLCAQTFLESPFDNIEKRIRRIQKIS